MTDTMKEVQRNEAVARLEILEKMGLEPSPVRDFKADGTLYYSERLPLGKSAMGVLYWTDNEEKFAKAVRDVEENYNVIVYHATHEYTNFGELLDLLYVSSEEDSWGWAEERQELEDGYASCYVVNFDEPDFSEFGSVFKVSGGGLVRVG